jgi:hypothetical protein
LTDEQLVALFDAAADRRQARVQADFEAQVEAVRIGTIIAHDRKAHMKWQHRKRADARSHGLTGMDLERAIGHLAVANPEYVVVGNA